MTYTPIPDGATDWDVPVNAAFVDQDNRITALEGTSGSLSLQVSINTSNISTLQGQVAGNSSNITTLQGQMSTANSNISTLQGQMTTANSNISTLQGQMTTANSNITALQTGKLDLTGGTLTGGLTGTTFTGSGTSQLSNLRVGSGSNFGGAIGGAFLLPQVTTPANANPSSGIVMYGTSTGLEARQADGTIMSGTRLGQLQASIGPSVQSFNSWTYDPEIISGTGNIVTSGTIYLHKIYLPANVTVASIALGVQTAGATLTAGQSLVGLYNSAGSRVAQSADQSGVWTSTGYKSAAMTASYTPTTAGFHYIAIVSVGTTPPTFYSTNAPSALFNGNVTGANLRHATNLTGQTTLPASLTLSSNVSTGANTWGATL